MNSRADGQVFPDGADCGNYWSGGFGRVKWMPAAAGLTRKDSVAFYLGMKEVVPEAAGKGKLEGIIKEEMRHIRILSEKLAAAGR